ncbi:MAG: hypothetical protein ACK4M0_01350 [Phreatobacter sp.]
MIDEPPAAPSAPVRCLRWLTAVVAMLAALMTGAMVLLSRFGTDAWMIPLVIAWNWVPIAGVWLVLDRTLSSRPAWATGLSAFGAMAVAAGWFLLMTAQQFLIQAHGWRIEGVRAESLYGLVSLIVPFYVGGVGLIGLAAAITVELVGRGRRAAGDRPA